MNHNFMREALGLLHLYIGNGKGKTTAAIGQAVRAHGCGLRVLLVQFLKGRPSGEIHELSRLGIDVRRIHSSDKFVFAMTDAEREAEKENYQAAMQQIFQQVSSENYDLVVLDEVLDACSLSMLSYELLYQLINRTKEVHCELVLTGRGVPKELYEHADYISEIHPVKHPFSKGIQAREGIEY